jgi:hypothetical protein
MAAGRKQLFSASRAMAMLGLAIFLVLVLVPGVWVHLLSPLFPNLPSILYDRTSFADLVLEHAFMVFVAGALASVLGVGLGVFVTRGIGRDFLPVVNAAVSIGQTFPPVAVLALGSARGRVRRRTDDRRPVPLRAAADRPQHRVRSGVRAPGCQGGGGGDGHDQAFRP